MTEEEKTAPVAGELSPHYMAAERDSGIIIRFVGNTPMVEGMQLIDASPFHMFAAAEFLRYQGNKYLAMEEARRAQQRIAVPGPGSKMPPPPGAN